MALKRSANDEYISTIVNLAQKKFRREQPESSADSVKSDDTHIIFYDSFEQFPVSLEGGCKINPKAWALAFLQPDLRSITRVLCESLFTQSELDSKKCNGARTLPSTKKLAILRAAKWLMNKNQDPWSFKPVLFPTDDERIEIDLVFDTFDKVTGSKENDDIGVEAESDEDMPLAPSPPPSDEMEMKPLPKVVLYEDDMDSALDIVSPENHAPYNSIYQELAKELIDSEYVDYYNKIMGLVKAKKTPSLGNSAQTAKALTKWVIRQNTDVFVDAVQFSKGRWAKAIQQKTIEKCAEVLFRKYFKTDFADNDRIFNNLDELSTPKQLALFRAVAWMKKLKEPETCWDDSFNFDSALPEHNVFLSVPEVNRIYNFITHTYGSKQAPFRPETFLETPPSTPPSTFVSSPQASWVERSTCIVSPTQVAISPSVPLSNLVMQQQRPMVQPQPMNYNGDVEINGHTFSAVCWGKALRKFRLDDGAEKAGKLLFEETFTDEEINTQTISGRGGKQKLSEDKVTAILQALEHIHGIVKNAGQPISLAESERKNLTKKIFTEHPNYLRRLLAAKTK